MNQEGFLEKIKATVHQKDEEAPIILFGSRARGDYKADSDWDFLILTEKQADYSFQRSIRNNLYDLELEYEELISTFIIEKSKWDDMEITPLHKNVTREGKAI
jgi:predicted nucleotidyltransferase